MTPIFFVFSLLLLILIVSLEIFFYEILLSKSVLLVGIGNYGKAHLNKY